MGSGARGEAGRRPGAQAVVACRGPLDGKAARGGGAEQAARRRCAGAVRGAHVATQASRHGGKGRLGRRSGHGGRQRSSAQAGLGGPAAGQAGRRSARLGVAAGLRGAMQGRAEAARSVRTAEVGWLVVARPPCGHGSGERVYLV